jgi:molybdopterin synthase catalytic subunit
MIIVQSDSFDTGAEIARMTAGRTDLGAVVSFTGLVRDFNDDAPVTTLTLEHYPGMTERELEKIEAAARERWALQDCRIIHRFGAMAPGEPIVLVLTASAHRQDAFEAAAFLMDWLKTKAPFWKLESGKDGRHGWVAERQSDVSAARKWEK